MHAINKLPIRSWLLLVMTFFISFEQFFVYKFKDPRIPHPGCPYHTLKYAFFDLFFLLLIPLVLKEIKALKKHPPALIMGGFLSLCVLSIATHAYPHPLIPLWFFVKLLLASTYFFGLLLEAHRPTFVRSLLCALAAATTAQALISLIQFINQASLGLKRFGEGVMSATKVIGSGFPISESSYAFLSYLLRQQGPLLMRAQGTLDHANHLGLILCLGIVTLCALYLTSTSKKRAWLILPLALQVLALMTTFSRASLFTLLLTLLIASILLNKRSLMLLKLTLPVLLAASTLFYPQIKERGGIFNSTAVNRFADSERLLYMRDALSMIHAHPLNGVGFHNYINEINHYASTPRTDDRPLLVHNIFLIIFAELGLPGLLLLLAFLLYPLLRALKHRSDPPTALFGAFLLALLFYASCDIFPLSEQQGFLTLLLSAALPTLRPLLKQRSHHIKTQTKLSKINHTLHFHF